jgi:hypothetical protein
MKRLAIVLSLLVATLWATESTAVQYAALEEMDLYAGVGTMIFMGDDAGGAGSDELLFGINLNGLMDYLVWQAFWGASFNGDAMLAGGSVDYVLLDNFGGFDCEALSLEDYLAWWVAAGPAFVSYRDMFEDAQGAGSDGEELGLNIGVGANRDGLAANFYLYYFPDSDNTMITAALTRSF